MSPQTETPAAPTRRPRTARRSAEAAPTTPPKTIQDVQDLLSRTLADLANGRLSAKRATAIAYGCRVLGEVLVGGRYRDLSERIERARAEIVAIRQAQAGVSGAAPQP